MKMKQVWLAIWVLAFLGCNVSDKSNTFSPVIMPGFVPDYLADTCFAGSQDFFSLATVEAFYKKRNYKTAWSANKKLTPQADSMINLIQNAKYYGLVSQDYHLYEIEQLVTLIGVYKGDSSYLAQADKLLTNSFFTMAYHLEKGRVEIKSNKKIMPPVTADTAYVALLENALKNSSIKKELESLEPKHPQYAGLKKALSQQLGFFENGFSHESAESIELGSLEAIKKLAINMERWRQEETFSEKHIFINIPAYRLDIIEKNDNYLSSRIIVGKPATRTPILDGLVECFIIYPYWTVPRSIATQELLPKIRKDVNFLSKNYYQVLDHKGNILDPHAIDWEALNSRNFPYTLRQTEGEYNAMGIVKFLFDNPYSVYMHDTNARSLFQRENRALSHGCIRVEKHHELAQFLVKNDSEFTDPQYLTNLFNSKKRRTINLKEPVPVHTRYFTAETFQDSLYMHYDIYKYDKKLDEAMFGSHPL